MLILSNWDTAQTAFFDRQLDDIKAQTYDILYPQLKGKLLVPPSSAPASPGKQRISYRTYDRVGVAKMIAAYADDLPRADIFGVETTSALRLLGTSIGYNYDEQLASQETGVNLPASKMQAARDVMEEQIDYCIAFGDSKFGLTGFLNNASVPAASVATSGGAVTWAAKAALNAEYIIKDVLDAYKYVVSTTKGIEMPNAFVCDVDSFLILSTYRLQDQNMTLLAYLKQALPGITTWDQWYRCVDAGSGGVKRFVIYTKDPRKLWYELPLPFTALAPQEKNLEIVVPCVAKVGGTIIPYPISMVYRDGI